MARDRTIPVDFWTREAVIDCQPMTRLLYIGLWNFADDHGVQPLRPRTIRLQVFPGDAVDNDAVRAMIDELAARGLVELYEVDGAEYLAIVDWRQFQRVGRNARRRYPAPRTDEATVTEALDGDEGLPAATPPGIADETILSLATAAPSDASSMPPKAAGDGGPEKDSPGESATGAAAVAQPRAPNGVLHAPAS